MELTRHEKATKRLLTEHYVHKTTIRDALRCDYEIALKIFQEAKSREKSLIDPRPHAAQSKLVIEVIGGNYNFMKKQFDEKMKQKLEGKE